MRHSITLRGVAAGLGAISLLVAMVAPVSAASPTPDAATLMARLTASNDPDAAFLNLSSAEQQAVVAYLTVVTTDSTETLARVGTATVVAPDAVIECWTITKTNEAKNYYGMTMFKIWSRLDWCANQSTHALTSAQKLRGIEVDMAYWQFTGYTDWYSTGGAGYGYYHVYLQGGFANCFPIIGCITYRYPWIDTTANWNGTVSGSMGG